MNLSTPLIGLADLWFIGNWKDLKSVASLSLASQIITIFIWIFSFLKNYFLIHFKTNTMSLKKSFAYCLLISLALMLLLYFIIPLTLDTLINLNSIHLGSFYSYFNTRLVSLFFHLASFVLIAYYLSQKKSLYPSLVIIFTQGLNVILNYILFTYFKQDIVVLAYASNISAFLGFTLLLIPLIKSQQKLKEKTHKKNHLSVLALRSLILVSTISFFKFYSSRYGSFSVSLGEILFQLFILSSYLCDGFASVLESHIVKLFKKQDKQLLKKCINLSALCLTFFCLSIYFFSYEMSFFFIKDIKLAQTIQGYAVPLIFTILLSAYGFLADGLFLALEKTHQQIRAMITSCLAAFSCFYVMNFIELFPDFTMNTLIVFLSLFFVLRSLYYLFPTVKLLKTAE